ncbi:MAG: hypothetical protein QME89_06795 [Actinomycetota bacterium]|nr:hypothetical protein [Actinomycetota bacterium]
MAGPSMTIPPYTRRSYLVDQYVTSFNVSTVVLSNSGPYLVCERAMYGGIRTWGHDSVGVTYSANFWCLPEGCTKGDFETAQLFPSGGAPYRRARAGL